MREKLGYGMHKAGDIASGAAWKVIHYHSDNDNEDNERMRLMDGMIDG